MQYQYSTDWFSEKIPSWKEKLGGFAGVSNIHALEIGCFEGRSAVWLLENILTHPTSRLTCVDIFEKDAEFREICERKKIVVPRDVDIEGNFDANMLTTGAGQRVTKLKGPSVEMVRHLPLNSFDIIYIDGSHTARNVLTDAVLCWDLLTVNGIMIFDDYLWNPFPADVLKSPRKAIDSFVECYEGEYLLLHKEYQVMVRKTKNIRMTMRSLSERNT